MMNEIKKVIDNFFRRCPDGIVTLCLPKSIWEHNKYGISYTKGTHLNNNKIKYMDEGILVKQTLGFSLVTNKHLYIPYNHIQTIIFEEDGEY